MQNQARTLRPHLFLALILAVAVSLPTFAQTIKRNPDGTVEVSDDDTSYAPVQHSSGSSGASRKSAKRSSAPRASGRIPGYTKRMGGVTVHRNADGTIEVTDNEMKSSSSAHGSSRRAGTSYGDGVAVTRHSDGRVDVHDTTMSHGSSYHKAGKGGTIPAYTKHHGDVAVKRNADGTVEVTDTSSSAKRKH